MNVFGLTSPAMPWIIGGLTVAVFLTASFGLPRLAAARARRRSTPRRAAGPGVLSYVLQTVSFLLVSLLLVMTIFVQLNRKFEWYASWSDLFGGSYGAPKTATVGAPVSPSSSAAAAAASRDATRPLTEVQRNVALVPAISKQIKAADPGQAKRHGLYVQFRLEGNASRLHNSVMVWLPPAYFTNTEKRFPVIMAYSGFPAAPSAYKKQVDIGSRILANARTHRGEQAIVVSPDVFPGNYDSECVDGTRGSRAVKMETWVVRDVVRWVKTNLRVHTSPDAWANLGYSAGGWCSAMYTMRHPEIFRYGLNLAGYFEPLWSPKQRWLPKDNGEYKLWNVARHKPPVDLWFYAGGQDNEPIGSMKKFRPSVAAPTRLTTEILPRGGHRMDVWLEGFDRGLARLAVLSPFFRAAEAKPPAR